MWKRKQVSKSPNSGPNLFRTRTALVGMFEAASKGGGGREGKEVDLSTPETQPELDGTSIKEWVSLLPRNTLLFIAVFQTTSQHSLEDHSINSVAFHQHKKKKMK